MGFSVAIAQDNSSFCFFYAINPRSERILVAEPEVLQNLQAELRAGRIEGLFATVSALVAADLLAPSLLE